MKGFDIVYVDKRFRVLWKGPEGYYLDVKHETGMTRISKREARELIQEHIRKEVRRGQRELNEVMTGEANDSETEKQNGGQAEGAGPEWPVSMSERGYL